MSTGSPGVGANVEAGPQHESATDIGIGLGNGTVFGNASLNGNDSESAIKRRLQASNLAEVRSPGSPPSGDARSTQPSMAPPAEVTSPGQVSGNDEYHENGSGQRRESWSSAASPRFEKGPYSSASSPVAHATSSGLPPAGTAATRYGMDRFSPTNVSQGVFSVNDSSDMSQARRANRRRTGPLTPEQRERAAVMRKLGACKDCRRRRVAVSLNYRLEAQHLFLSPRPGEMLCN